MAGKDTMGHGSIAPKVPDMGFKDWANSKNTNCSICALPRVRDKVKEFLEMKAKGETARSYRELHDWLIQQLDFKGARSTIQEHMRRCEPELKKAADDRPRN